MICQPISLAFSKRNPLFAFLLSLLVTSTQIETIQARSQDWSTYMGDASRSGLSHEKLPVPLVPLWTYKASHLPQPAWPSPAEQDWWHNVRQLSPAVVYDRAFHVAISNQGLFFGSSGDDCVHCLDPETGETKWTFPTGAPLRLCPFLYKGKLYVGSDDGWIYCLSEEDGKLHWKTRIGASPEWLPGNGRLVSICPIRTGIVVVDDIVFAAAGLFPTQEAHLCALNAKRGDILWRQTLDISPQGYLLSSPHHLFVPTGRTSPQLFSLETGKKTGSLPTPGGAFALLSEDLFFNAPGRREGQIAMTDPVTKESIAVFDGLRVVVDRENAFLVRHSEITGIQRERFSQLSRQRSQLAKKKEMITNQMKLKKNSKDIQELHKQMVAVEREIGSLQKEIDTCTLWKKQYDLPYAMISTRNALLAGGDDTVACLDKKSGETLWEAAVQGRAYGLAVWNEKIYVSTDQGTIHCFGEEKDRRDASALKTEVSELSEPEPYAEDAAKELLVLYGGSKGYALLLGKNVLPLTRALCRASSLQIALLAASEPEVLTIRRSLCQGETGGRVTVLLHEGGPLPFPDELFDLIVMTENVSPPENLPKLVRPFGGMMLFMDNKLAGNLSQDLLALPRWVRTECLAPEQAVLFTKGPLSKSDGYGNWTHLYSNPANTGCSEESNLSKELKLQWFGAPGPRRMVDRHHRSMSPLFAEGILVVCGNEFISGVDAYNGTILWEREVPGFLRLAMMNDTGNACIQRDLLYLAVGPSCLALDLHTGEDRETFPVPAGGSPHPLHWGYIAATEQLLLGSTELETASFRDFGWGNSTVGQIEGDFRPKATSASLFALERKTGNLLWQRQEGVIHNSTLALGSHHVFFAESQAKEVMEDEDGRMSTQVFCKEPVTLVALQPASGRVAWERELRLPFEHIFFLSVAQDLLLATGSYNAGKKVEYGFFAFREEDGSLAWKTTFQTGQGIGGTHGEQWQHPTIVDDKLYLMPFGLSLKTGERLKDFQFGRGGHGCGTVTASAGHLFLRGGNPQLFDLETSALLPVNTVTRPGCWINVLPAGGLLLLPETSSGCTCAYPLQTSLAYRAR